MQIVYLQRIMKKNADKGYEKTKPIQTQSVRPALFAKELPDWSNPISNGTPPLITRKLKFANQDLFLAGEFSQDYRQIVPGPCPDRH